MSIYMGMPLDSSMTPLTTKLRQSGWLTVSTKRWENLATNYSCRESWWIKPHDTPPPQAILDSLGPNFHDVKRRLIRTTNTALYTFNQGQEDAKVIVQWAKAVTDLYPIGAIRLMPVVARNSIRVDPMAHIDLDKIMRSTTHDSPYNVASSCALAGWELDEIQRLFRTYQEYGDVECCWTLVQEGWEESIRGDTPHPDKSLSEMVLRGSTVCIDTESLMNFQAPLIKEAIFYMAKNSKTT